MSAAPAATAPKADELPEVVCVYVGLRETTGGKLAAGFVLPDALEKAKDASEISASLFTLKKGELPRVVGGLYRVKGRVEDGSLNRILGSFKSTGDKWHSAAMVAGMEAHHRANQVAERARKEDEANRKDRKLSAILDPLRRRYTSTDEIGRLALEVVVLAELRRGRFAS